MLVITQASPPTPNATTRAKGVPAAWTTTGTRPIPNQCGRKRWGTNNNPEGAINSGNPYAQRPPAAGPRRLGHKPGTPPREATWASPTSSKQPRCRRETDQIGRHTHRLPLDRMNQAWESRDLAIPTQIRPPTRSCFPQLWLWCNIDLYTSYSCDLLPLYPLIWLSISNDGRYEVCDQARRKR
jgi:hypothetical protein